MKKSRKNWLKFTAAILTMAGTVTALAACNNNSTQQPNIPAPTPSEQTISVSLIYDGIGVSMDTKAMLQNEVNEIAENVYGDADVKAYGLKDDNLQVISMVGDSLSSVVVELPEETLNYLNGDVKENVLDRAQLTADQQVKESERQQIVDRLTSAVEYIESQIGNISNLPASRVNYYADGETQENVNNETLFSVLGPVLADGSFIRYDVRENGNLFETVIVVPNADGKTEQQIYEAYFSGNYSVGASTEVDLDAEYTPPTPTDPDNPDPDNPGGGEEEETITIGEIFDQNFANIDFSNDLNQMFTGLIQKGFTNAQNIEVLTYTLENSQLNIYYEMTRNGLASFNKLSLDIPEIIETIQTNLKDYILQQLGYSSNSEVEQKDADKYVDQMNNIVAQIVDEILAVVSETGIRDMSNETYGRNGTNAPENVADFGEALMEDLGAEGTIIATYVGDMSGRDFDSTGIFGTGYLSGFDITVVYKNGDEISIVTTECLVPWYTNSTNQSQYGEFVKDGGTYKLRNTQTTTIENPIDLYLMVNENDSSLMGVMLQDKHSKEITDMFLV